MPKNTKIIKATLIINEKGQGALDLAKQIMKEDKVHFKPLQEAITYFMNHWGDVLHPALVSLSCEAVGGDSASTTKLGAALVLLAGAADIHDDIIDQSLTKDTKLTVFGKYGKDIALLAGDILIFKGAYTLFEACSELSIDKRQRILKNVKKAFCEVSEGEAEDAGFRGKKDLTGEEYFENIVHKAAAEKTSAIVGAIFGNASESEIEILGNYAKTLGVLISLRDEIIDMYERDELENRFKRECLPLPILLAFKNQKNRKVILESLEKKLTDKDIDEILDLVLDSKEFTFLKVKMKTLLDEGKQKIIVLKNSETLKLLINSTIAELN